MKVYYIDYKPEDMRRDWQAILNPEAKNVSFSENLSGVFNSRIANGIIIGHLAQSTKVITGWDTGLREKGLWLVAVTGGGYGADTPGTERIYFRKSPVKDKQHGIDEQFKDRFREFWADIEKQEEMSQPIKPRFELLDPFGVPENLLAWALAMQMKKEGFVLEINDTLVQKEFLELKEVVGSNPRKRKIVSELTWTHDADQNFINSVVLIQSARDDL
jgi:hypothetical protein